VRSLTEAWRAFLVAGRFLTRLPFPDPGLPSAAEPARGALFYPLVGLLIGALLAGSAALLEQAPPLAAAALLLILWVWLTGGLHLDGLADCADAWVGGLGSRERTFAILKDPHTGAMGVITLVLALLAKLAGLATLLEQGAFLALLWLPTLARAWIERVKRNGAQLCLADATGSMTAQARDIAMRADSRCSKRYKGSDLLP